MSVSCGIMFVILCESFFSVFTQIYALSAPELPRRRKDSTRLLSHSVSGVIYRRKCYKNFSLSFLGSKTEPQRPQSVSSPLTLALLCVCRPSPQREQQQEGSATQLISVDKINSRFLRDNIIMSPMTAKFLSLFSCCCVCGWQIQQIKLNGEIFEQFLFLLQNWKIIFFLLQFVMGTFEITQLFPLKSDFSSPAGLFVIDFVKLSLCLSTQRGGSELVGQEKTIFEAENGLRTVFREEKREITCD